MPREKNVWSAEHGERRAAAPPPRRPPSLAMRLARLRAILAARLNPPPGPRPPRVRYRFPDRMELLRRRLRERWVALQPPPEWRDPWLGPQFVFFYAAVLLLAATAVLVDRQAVRPDPLEPPRPFSPAWWRYPVEWGAERRLATIPGELRAFSTVPGSAETWVAGEHGIARGRVGSGWKPVPAVLARQGDAAALLKQKASLAKQTPVPAGPAAPGFLALQFGSARSAWAVTETGELVRSHDGGRNWAGVPGAPRARTRPSLWVRGASEGWLLMDSAVYQLTAPGLAPGPRARLPGARALHFPTARLGWAVGDSGRVWHTDDAGANWRRQRTRGSLDLSAVHFADARRGVAVGPRGVILYTQDGGARWSTAAAPVRADLHAVWMAGRRGWAVGGGGTVLVTRNGGVSWRERRAGKSALRFVRADAAGRVWTGGRAGLFSSADRGRTWLRLAADDATQVQGLSFASERLGFAVTSGGAVLKTRNGGDSWRTTHQAGVALHAVEFASRTHGWIGGDSGRVLATRDGGLTWRPQVTERNEQIRALHFMDDSTGWAADAGGGVLSTRDGGRSWHTDTVLAGFSPRGLQMQRPGTGWMVGDGGRMARLERGLWAEGPPAGVPAKVQSVDLADVHFADSLHGWVVGEDGALLRTADGGRTWRLHFSRWPVDLLSVHFSDAATGVAGGRHGRVLLTRDGGRVWIRQDLGDTLGDARAVFAGASGRLWAAGARGTVFSSVGGLPWRDERRHVVLPSPWFYPLMAVVLLLLVPVFVREAGPREVLLAADRPLRADERDSLRLGEVAHALSRFIRNDATEAPLTIAITGRWGSGKSSLMNLLRADLEKHGYPIVAFNAWHHQKEESLLASLLENVRLQAIPSAVSWPGLWYRGKMLRYRMKRHWLVSVVLVASAAYGLGYFAQDFPDRLLMALEPLLGIVQLKGPVGGLDRPFLSLVALVPPVVALFRNLKGFGLDPARLVASEQGGSRRAELRAQAGFRHLFAAEFADVTRALPNEIVIMVDDLDRCPPESLRDLLEAINFLTSSGNCYVVMGLDRALVRRYLGQTFTEVAREITGEANGQGTRYLRERRRMARHYLEKLIQVEVKIPAPTPAQIGEILQPPPSPPDVRGCLSRARDHGVAVVRGEARFAAAAALCVMLSLLGLAGSGVFRLPERVLPSVPHALAEVMEFSGSVLPRTSEPLPALTASAPADQAAGVLSRVVVRVAADPAPAPLPVSTALAPEDMWPSGLGGAARIAVLLLAVAGLSMAAALLARLKDVGSHVRDSSDVARALEICHRAIAACRPTPRRLKHFQRRVRYYVALEQARAGGGAFPQAGSPPVRRIPEAALVALTMVETFFQEWLRDPRLQGDVRALVAELPLEGEEEGEPDHASRRDHLYRESLTHFLKAVRINAYVQDFRRFSSELADYRRSSPAVGVAEAQGEPALREDAEPGTGTGPEQPAT